MILIARAHFLPASMDVSIPTLGSCHHMTDKLHVDTTPTTSMTKARDLSTEGCEDGLDHLWCSGLPLFIILGQLLSHPEERSLLQRRRARVVDGVQPRCRRHSIARAIRRPIFLAMGLSFCFFFIYFIAGGVWTSIRSCSFNTVSLLNLFRCSSTERKRRGWANAGRRVGGGSSCRWAKQ